MPKLLPATEEKIRARIEDAAARLLAERGYEQTGMRDVADAAGMSAAALYNHYASKEQLFGAIVGRYRGRIGEDSDENPLADYVARCAFPDDLPMLARAIERVVLRDKPYLVLWYIDLLSFGGRHFKRELAPTVLLEKRLLTQRFDELRRTKRLRVDPEFAFTMIYVHLFNFFLSEHVFGSGNSYGLLTDAAVKRICDVFLHGVSAAAPRKRRGSAAAPRRRRA